MSEEPKITLFVQCLIDAMYPEVGEAVVKIFDRLGIPVECPGDQTCCGQVAYNSGYFKHARAAARHFIELFDGARQIVCPSGSCVHMVRHQYPKLFESEPEWYERARVIGDRIFELSQYLVDVRGIDNLGAVFQGKVTIHNSCHALRGLGIYEQPRKLIRAVKGIELVEMTDSKKCCGFGGSFSIKYPEISTAIVEEKANNIINSGADTVVGVDVGCLMNIQGRLSRKKSPIKVMHLAQVLARSI